MIKNPNPNFSKYVTDFRATVLDFRIRYLVYISYGFEASDYSVFKERNRKISLFSV